MYILLKCDHLNNTKNVISIIYTDKCDEWIKIYLNEQIEVLKEVKNEDSQVIDVTYSIENNSLIKNETIIRNGYLYNNKINKSKKICTIEYYAFNPKNIETIERNVDIKLWQDINTEINLRVLKSMDKDSLYQIFVEINKNLGLKDKWSSQEYTNLLNTLLKSFKKDLYSSIVKKLKRFKTLGNQ